MDTSLDGLKKLGTKMGGDMTGANTNAEALDVIADVYVDKEGTTLPNPTSSNAGKVATVVSKGSGKYAWDAADAPSPIDDSASSSTKTYSSQKIESMLSNELPTPSADNLGKIARVVSDGQGGYAWSAEDQEEEFVITLTNNNGEFTTAATFADLKAAIEAGKSIFVALPSNYTPYASDRFGGAKITPVVAYFDAGTDTVYVTCGFIGGDDNTIDLFTVYIEMYVEENSDVINIYHGEKTLTT